MADSANRKIDQYSDAELIAAFWSYFGGRGVGILGWCAVGFATGADNPVELRRLLEQRGLSRSSLYQALDALRLFYEHMEGQPLPRRDASYAVRLLRRIATASMQSTLPLPT